MRASLPNPDVLDVCEHLSLQHRSGREGEGGDQIGGGAGMSELDGDMNPPYPPSVVDCIHPIVYTGLSTTHLISSAHLPIPTVSTVPSPSSQSRSTLRTVKGNCTVLMARLVSPYPFTENLQGPHRDVRVPARIHPRPWDRPRGGGGCFAGERGGGEG